MAYPSLPRTIAGGLLVAAVAGALFSQDLGRYPLRDPDQARHAGAALVAASSAGWFALARYANLDMLFTACVTVGVLAGLAWLERPAARRPMLAPFVAAGLGTLVKGPLAGVLIGAPLVLAVLVT